MSTRNPVKPQALCDDPETVDWIRERAHMLVPVVVIAVAAALRLWALTYPPDLYWDEQHYVFDAEAYIGGGIGIPVGDPPPVLIADEGTWVHPPLGKWIIALLGVGPMGLRSIGWRLPSAVFGIAGVGLLYFLALELWGSVWWAGLAALLLALDGLHIVQSRIAMLDIFPATFVTAGILLLVLDRTRSMGPRSDERSPPGRMERIFGSWYRLGTGCALGAAIATKWTGVLALLLGAGLCTAWLIAAGPRDRRAVARSLGTIVASFAVAPLVVYLVSYGAFFYQNGPAVGDFVTLQIRMLQYHLGHTQLQPENSLPQTWPVMLHPIQYFGLSTPGGTRKIVALGNPVLWWGFLALLPLAIPTVVRTPTWQDAVAFGGYTVMYLPWLAVQRSQFIFYMLPAVPFMCLAIVASLRRGPRSAARIAAPTIAGLVLVAAAAFAPVWLGLPASASWLARLRLLPTWRL